MARVTIEDCLKHVKNNFDLVILASVYAKDISGSLFEKDKPKSHVVALREIANGNISSDSLRERLMKILSNSNINQEDEFAEEELEENKEIEHAVNDLESLAVENLSLDEEN